MTRGFPVARLTLVALVMYGVLALVTVAVMGLLWEGAVASALYPLDGVLVGVSVGGLAGGGLVLGSRWWERASDDASALQRRFVSMLRGLGPTDALVLAAVSSVAEELLFRGLLLPTVGVWASSVYFGLLHSGPERVFLVWTVAAIAVGGLFGVLALATGSLWAPTVAHFLVNWLNLRRILRP